MNPVVKRFYGSDQWRSRNHSQSVFGKDVPKLSGLPQMHQSMLTSLFLNLKEAIFPKNYRLYGFTSRPVNVGEIWSIRVLRKRPPGH